MISIAGNCAVWAVRWQQPPQPKYCFRGAVFELAKPVRRNSEISHGQRTGTPIHACLFKRGRNRCRTVSERTRCIGNRQTQNTFWCRLVCRNSGDDFPKFCYECAHCGPLLTLVFQFSFESVHVWAVITDPPPATPKVNGFFEPITNYTVKVISQTIVKHATCTLWPKKLYS